MVEDKKRIVIECSCSPCHDWMAFAAWYSFRKMIPDVEVCLDVEIDRPMFRWMHIFSSKRTAGPWRDVVFPPTVIAVRDFEGDWTPAPSRSNSQTCLVDYSGGCGSFVVAEWINRNRHPFHRALMRFGRADMTVNEVAVLKMWERCESLYGSAGV